MTKLCQFSDLIDDADNGTHDGLPCTKPDNGSWFCDEHSPGCETPVEMYDDISHDTYHKSCGSPSITPPGQPPRCKEHGGRQVIMHEPCEAGGATREDARPAAPDLAEVRNCLTDALHFAGEDGVREPVIDQVREAINEAMAMLTPDEPEATK